MAKKLNIMPLGDRMLIRPLSEDELSSASALGIILPESSKTNTSGQGNVVAVGDGKLLDSGERVQAPVAVGDRVMYGKYTYETVTVDGDEYHIVSGDNVLAIFK